MEGLSARSATWLFVTGIVVLAFLAFVADRSASRYAASEAWVSHTREVETELALLQADIARASRRSYQDILAGEPEASQHQQANFADVRNRMAQIENLIVENQVQQRNFEKLRPLIERRIAILGNLIATVRQQPTRISGELRSRITEEGDLATQVNAMIGEMQIEEEQLLNSRRQESAAKYTELRVMLAAALLVVLMLLLGAFRGVWIQLRLRTTAERTVRTLSRHVLRAQDEERRRLSRELHDSIGQLFAGLDMELGSLATSERIPPEEKADVGRCQAIVAQGLSETRTISHLLHPPMLEEMGFEHAAKWYVEGFSERSKILTRITVTQPFGRLNPDTELVLYRFIQEALTNIHRHSGSRRAEITVELKKDRVIAEARDFGRGIKVEVLQIMQESSAGSGVGLGGMQERVAELGGELKLKSSSEGTTVTISIPVEPFRQSDANGDAERSFAQGRSRQHASDKRDDGEVSGQSLAVAI